MLLRKNLYPYEYMDSWERFNETALANKKAFYSKLYLEDITDEDYVCAQKVFEEFELKRWVSWFIYLKWYIIACRCIWKF